MTKQNLKSVAVWQPYFLGGGAEAVALWILEALQDHYDLTLHTLAPVDFAWLNAMYNTHLRPKKIKVKTYLPHSLAKGAYYVMPSNDILKKALVYLTIRGLKQKSSQYDAVFSAFNGIDIGIPGIQYLHWVHVVEQFPQHAPLWYKLLMKWVDFSHSRLCENLSVANSEYTAQKVKDVYGIDAKVVFPPVITEINALPWEEKEDAFLCSGRLVKAKEPHRVIRILKGVRERGFDIKLHITGGGGGVYEQGYQKQLYKTIRENSDWVHLHQNLPYVDYLKVAGRCRYGLHFKPEPFGISVAEMIKAGTIPFVKSVGGQVEIVGEENTELHFSTEEEAIRKITRVLKNDSLRINLSETLKKRKSLFTTERFIDEIKNLTETFLAQS
jgi:glycosyltransferase involved in cell wall biosynthesis